MNNGILLHTGFSLMGYRFFSPEWFWLLLLIPLFLFLNYWWINKSKGIYKFTGTEKELSHLTYRPFRWIIGIIYGIISLGIASLIFAMAEPYTHENIERKQYGKGIDIMISMDISGSMLATDFLPNRLEVAKDVAKKFISARSSDRIGMIAFEGEAYTVCPPTQDYAYLKKKISQVHSGFLTPGTAIGTGLGTAIAQIYQDTIQSKVVILLTDGVSNTGDISPMAAASIAKKYGIRVYTIGVGKKGYAKMPIQTPFGTIVQRTKVNIDEALLKKISTETGGKYFRATNKESLINIYKQIDQLEKSKIISNVIHRQPPFQPGNFLLIGFILLSLGLFVEQLFIRNNG